MTYTKVFKDYVAMTFEAAAAACLQDSEVFEQDMRTGVRDETIERLGNQKGYSIESWGWDGARLRVWFR